MVYGTYRSKQRPSYNPTERTGTDDASSMLVQTQTQTGFSLGYRFATLNQISNQEQQDLNFFNNLSGGQVGFNGLPRSCRQFFAGIIPNEAIIIRIEYSMDSANGQAFFANVSGSLPNFQVTSADKPNNVNYNMFYIRFLSAVTRDRLVRRAVQDLNTYLRTNSIALFQ